MSFVSRVLLLAGAGCMAVSVLLPWVMIEGPTIALDLGLIGAQASAGSRTVAGTDTSIWPAIAGVAVVIAILGGLQVARGLLIAAGLILLAAGGALLYYVSNVVEIEGSGRGAVGDVVAETLITSTAGLGPPLLIAAGIAILTGALLAR